MTIEPAFAPTAHELELARPFDGAMTSSSRKDAREIADTVDLSRHELIVDVGGGQGLLLTEILRVHPGTRGILFDQPHVIERAVLDPDVVARITCIGGDFFRTIPPGADAYLFKTVLHGWDDVQAEAILRRVRKAIGRGHDAKLFLFEPVIADDIHMLVNAGGRERTQDEWRRLLERAGFAMVGVSPTIPPLSIVEAVPV